jgi:hypothetical protein
MRTLYLYCTNIIRSVQTKLVEFSIMHDLSTFTHEDFITFHNSVVARINRNHSYVITGMNVTNGSCVTEKITGYVITKRCCFVMKVIKKVRYDFICIHVCMHSRVLASSYNRITKWKTMQLLFFDLFRLAIYQIEDTSYSRSLQIINACRFLVFFKEIIN